MTFSKYSPEREAPESAEVELTVINIEAGRTAAKRSTIAKLAAALGVPPERISGGAP